MLLADNIVITGQDVVNWSVPTILGAIALWFRSHMLDGLRRLRFMMGFVTLLATKAKDVQAVMRQIDPNTLSEPGRKLYAKLLPLVNGTADLADELTKAPEKNHRIDESLLLTLEQMIRDHHKPPPIEDKK